MSDSEGIPVAALERIFDAALLELVESGIDEFAVDRVARRAGVDPEVLHARWRDRRVLLMEAMLVRIGQLAPVPDTGSLRTDLRGFSDALTQISDTELGRHWLHRLLPGGRDADFSEVGSDFWVVKMDDLEQMFRHAAEREELRAGLDTGDATRMLAAALYYDVIFNDTPVRPEYAAQVCEIFLYGVLATQIHGESLIQDFRNREHMHALLRATTDAMIDPVALVEAVRDDDGRIDDFTFREVNPAACTYLQRRRDELIGGSMKATLPDIESSGMLARYIDCVQTGDPLIVEGFEYFSQRYQQIRNYDLRAARAGTDWLSMTWRDVTDRVQGVQRALAAQTLLAATADSMLTPQSLLEAVRDPAGQVVDFVHRSANPAFCSYRGWEEQDIIGTSLTDARPSLLSSALFEQCVNCVDTGESVILDNVDFFNALRGEVRKLDIRVVRAGVDLISLSFSDVTERFLSAERIAKSEEHYRLLAENSTDVVVHVRDGVVVWVSPSVNAVFGAPDSYWVGRRIQEVSPPEEAPAFARRMATLASGSTVRERIRVFSMDGVTHWISMHAKPFYDVSGHRDGFIASLRVIDDEVAAERAVEETRQQLEQARIEKAASDALERGVIERSIIPTAMSDLDGRFVLINNAMCNFVGYDADTLRQMTWQEIVAPEFLAAALQALPEMLAGKLDPYRVQQQYLHRDGRRVWGDLAASVIRTLDGEPQYLIAQILDITAEMESRRQMELARREQARADALFRRLSENAAVGMCLADLEGRFVEVNAALCEFFGYDSETLRQMTWQELTDPDYLEADLANRSAVLAGTSDSYRMIKKFIHADGHPIWGDISVSCLRDGDGHVELFIGQIIDMTAEVQTRNELVASEASNRDLAESLRSEMQGASRYLRAVLPANLDGRVSVSACYEPSQTLGGDCFDFFWIDEDHLIVYLLDVSGHGVESALVAVSVHNMLRSASFTTGILLEPEQVLTALNNQFEMADHDGNFLTIFYGVYQHSTGTLRYAGGGHPPALLFTGDQVTALPNQSLPVGMFSDTRFLTTTVRIPPGSQILIYSDGAYEIPLDDGGQGSHEDFVDTCTRVAKAPAWSLEELVGKLRDRSAIKSFTDDCCLVRMAF